MVTRKRAVLIAGPTASGKSSLALKLARALDGVVINADSMQVYRELHILTARPTEEHCAAAPHRLYGHVGAAQRYSVGAWLGDIEAELSAVWQAGGVPFIVGGTGLYFKGLEEGIADIPSVPQRLHEAWRERLEQDGADALHEELKKRDAALAARLRPSETQRVLRGIEVHDATGKALSLWQMSGNSAPVLEDVEAVRLLLELPRDELYRRCDQRFEEMIAAGALEEVTALLKLKLDPYLPAMKALGVRQLKAYLDGQCSMEAASEAVQTWTRRYAKRQLTWFRSNMISWKRISAQHSERSEAEIFAILRENELTP